MARDTEIAGDTRNRMEKRVAKKTTTQKTTTSKAAKKTKRASAASASRSKKIVKAVTGKKKVKKVTAGTTNTGPRTTASKTTKAKSAPKTSPSSNSKAKKTSPRDTPSKKIGKNNRVQAQVSAATTQDPIQFVEETRRIPKTYLTAKELREFKTLLLSKRAEMCGDVQHLTNEALNRTEGGAGEGSSMPIHMADLGSDNWEQEFTLGLIANEQAVVREIDSALERVENRTYGICIATHTQISKARLRAKLWAKYCIDYARAREEGRAI